MTNSFCRGIFVPVSLVFPSFEQQQQWQVNDLPLILRGRSAVDGFFREYYQSYSYMLTELKKNIRPPNKRASLCQFTNSISTARHLFHSPFWRGGDAVNFLSPWVTSQAVSFSIPNEDKGKASPMLGQQPRKPLLSPSNSEVSILS